MNCFKNSKWIIPGKIIFLLGLANTRLKREVNKIAVQNMSCGSEAIEGEYIRQLSAPYLASSCFALLALASTYDENFSSLSLKTSPLLDELFNHIK